MVYKEWKEVEFLQTGKCEHYTVCKMEIYKDQDTTNYLFKEQEERLLQRENNIDRRDLAMQNRENALEERENNLLDKQQKIQEAKEEMEEIKRKELEELEKISKYPLDTKIYPGHFYSGVLKMSLEIVKNFFF